MHCFEGALADALLAATQGRLHELVADGSHVLAIAKHCARLRNRQLGYWPDDLRDVLRAVGPTLESLAIKSGAFLVRALCPELTRIALYMCHLAEDSQSAYARLLCSYGPQLRFVDLYHLPSALCQDVRTACPNMSCEVDHNPSVETLLAVGPALATLGFYVDEDIVEAFLRAVRSCTGLKDITLFCTAGEVEHVIKEVLGSPKPRLAKLRIDIVGWANNLINLREHGNLAETLREASSGGAPLLQNVFLAMGSDIEEVPGYEVWVADICQACLTYPNLQHLDITDVPLPVRTSRITEVDDICCCMRLLKRNYLSVSVFGVKYMA